MTFRIPAARWKEGEALLQVPRQSFANPHRCEVFFNPAMRFSRSMGSLATGVLKPKKILDGLCATGARGIRYAKENPSVEKLVLLDANPLALPFVEKNVSLNKLAGKAECVCEDFNDYCDSNAASFDWIEIDPFGTPAPFVAAALQALGKPGVLSVTSTDLANVVKKNAPTLRDYGAKPLYNDFSHETALRIILGFIARKAFEQKLSITPLLCFYELHHVKMIVRVESKRKPLKQKIGFVSYCDKCLSRFEGKKKKCRECGNRLLYAGPLWLGSFCDEKVLREMRMLNEKRNFEDKKKIEKTLSLLEKEQGFPPWFYNVHSVADHYGLSIVKKIDEIVLALKEKGFQAERTHFEPTGVKTPAPVKTLIAFI